MSAVFSRKLILEKVNFFILFMCLKLLQVILRKNRILVLIVAKIKSRFNSQVSSEKSIDKILQVIFKYESKRFLGHKQGTIKKRLLNKKDFLFNSTGNILISLVKQMNSQPSDHLTEF